MSSKKVVCSFTVTFSVCTLVFQSIRLVSSSSSFDNSPICLANRLPCQFRFPNTTIPTENQYGVYTTRISVDSNGTASCSIRHRNSQIRAIDQIGGSDQLHTIFSPGWPSLYGNQMFVLYKVSCPEDHLSYFSLTDMKLEEPNCYDPLTNTTKCVDYIQVNVGEFGVVEFCGSLNNSEITSVLGLEKLDIIFRTSDTGTFPGFRASVVCIPLRGTDFQCQELVHPKNGSIHYSESPIGLRTVATYECDPGYKVIGPVNRTCVPSLNNNNGSSPVGVRWSGSSTFCEAIQCPPLAVPENGMIQYSLESSPDYDVGTIATYNCSVNFVLEGNLTQICVNVNNSAIWDTNTEIRFCKLTSSQDVGIIVIITTVSGVTAITLLLLVILTVVCIVHRKSNCLSKSKKTSVVADPIYDYPDDPTNQNVTVDENKAYGMKMGMIKNTAYTEVADCYNPGNSESPSLSDQGIEVRENEAYSAAMEMVDNSAYSKNMSNS